MELPYIEVQVCTYIIQRGLDCYCYNNTIVYNFSNKIFLQAFGSEVSNQFRPRSIKVFFTILRSKNPKKRYFEQFRRNIFKHNLWYLFLYIYNLILVLQHDIRHLSISQKPFQFLRHIVSAEYTYTLTYLHSHTFILHPPAFPATYTVRTHFVAKMKKY